MNNIERDDTSTEEEGEAARVNFNEISFNPLNKH